MDKESLAGHAAEGLERCLLKLSTVSPGEWRLAGARIFRCAAREALRRDEKRPPLCEAVRIKVKGDVPFSTVLLYDPADTRHITRCFVHDSVYASIGPEQADVTGVELGNIVLNALVNALLKAFRRTAVPSVPAYFRGDLAAIERWLGAGHGDFTVISASFSVHRDGRAAHAEVLAFLPPEFTAGA